MEGYFVVKDREGFFNAIAPDMKLEQTNQRSSKSTGGVVGATRNLRYCSEWHLNFHEVQEMAQVFRDLMGENSMAHGEVSSIHHELVGRKAQIYHENLVKVFDKR